MAFPGDRHPFCNVYSQVADSDNYPSSWTGYSSRDPGPLRFGFFLLRRLEPTLRKEARCGELGSFLG
jgi:hypothetical protein